MAAFEYTALDVNGREVRGVQEGESARHVRQLLRDQQLLPMQVSLVTSGQVTKGVIGKRSLPRGNRVSNTDLALLTRQLSTLVKAALPLEDALRAVSEQSEKPAVKKIVTAVRARVTEGLTLAAALAEFPRVFPDIYRATVAAGEQSGRLDVVLERLADYTESRDQLRQRVIGALLYPIVLTIMCIAIIAGLLTYVVPKVVEVFESGQNALPWMTQVLLLISDGLREYGLWMLLVLTIAAVLVKRWLRAPEARYRFDGWMLRLPLVGKLIRGFDTARFTRTLSILTGSAVPVLEGLQIAGAVISNRPMRAAVEEAAERIREGAPIGRSLAVSKLFPPMTVHLIASGEASGRLEEMLDRAATNQERELDGLLTALVGLLGPLMIVGMGVFVLAIVFAMLMPIFEMNTLVR